jgi:hypothetical protein
MMKNSKINVSEIWNTMDIEEATSPITMESLLDPRQENPLFFENPIAYDPMSPCELNDGKHPPQLIPQVIKIESAQDETPKFQMPEFGNMDHLFSKFYDDSEISHLQDRQPEITHWKKAYEDQVSKNMMLQKDIETHQIYLGFCTEIMTINEQFNALKQKGDDPPEISKSLLEMNQEEFTEELTTEFPQAPPLKIKQVVEKRRESLILMREITDLFSNTIVSTVDKIIERWIKKSLDPVNKKSLITFVANLCDNVKEACRTGVEDEMRKYLEKSNKGRNKPLPDESKRILKTWFLDHFKHPYPTEPEKDDLILETGLNKTQINNWFINKRVRVWRPLIKRLFPDSKNELKANKEKQYLNKCKDIEQLSSTLENTL